MQKNSELLGLFLHYKVNELGSQIFWYLHSGTLSGLDTGPGGVTWAPNWVCLEGQEHFHNLEGFMKTHMRGRQTVSATEYCGSSGQRWDFPWEIKDSFNRWKWLECPPDLRFSWTLVKMSVPVSEIKLPRGTPGICISQALAILRPIEV